MVPPFIYLSLAEKNSVSQVNFFGETLSCLELIDPPHILKIDGVQQLDIVKFALPFDKISFHPIFSTEGKHTNFFMSGQAASRP
ncbi:MAG: hypothetical protein PWP69_1196 [Enterococcus sp.]|nr:hypothetical protein [Enterococcus sp.]